MRLYLLSAISDLIIQDILQKTQLSSGDVEVICFVPELVEQFRQRAGIHAMFIQPPNAPPVDYYDKYVNSGSLFSGEIASNFPMWKAIGIDRMGMWFWQGGQPLLDILKMFKNPEEVVISLDIMRPQVWGGAWLFHERGIPIRGIQIPPLRTREMLDIVGTFPFSEVTVAFEDDALAVFNGVPCKVAVANKGKNRPRTGDARANRGKAIVFDKRDEWQFRKYVTTNAINRATDRVFVFDSRSDELISQIYPNNPFVIYRNPKLLATFAEIILFRFDESVVYSNTGDANKVLIYDYNGINLAKQLVGKAVNTEVIEA